MKKVLIAGASGYLGGFVVKEFKKQGYYVKALARDPKKLAHLDEHIDEMVIGEVTDPKSLEGCCDGMDVVFSSIGITRQKDNLSYMDVDYQGNKNLLEEVKQTQGSKFIYVSVFNAEKMTDLKCIQAKQKFEHALRDSGLDYSIIYPNGFFSDMLDYLKMAQSGRGFVFGSGENKINPIHGEDLAEVCVSSVTSADKKIHVGGPETLSHNEVLTIAFEAVEKKMKVTRIPIWVRNLMLSLIRMFTSVKTYGPLEFFMTVLVMDMVAPNYGSRKIKEFFVENAQKS